MVQSQAIPYLTGLLNTPDSKLKRQLCSCLSQVAKHTVELAEVIIDAQIFPAALIALHDADPFVRKHCATLLCEIAKHTPELSQLIVSSGGVPAIVDYTSQAETNNKLPGVMALGYIAAFNETLAAAVVLGHGIVPLAEALNKEPKEHIKAAAAWSLGQLGRHSIEHAKQVASHGVLLDLLHTFMNASDSDVGEDLKIKVKTSKMKSSKGDLYGY